MKNIQNPAIFYALIILLSSCGKPIDITSQYDLSKDASKVPPYVIEGMITNSNGPHYVRITKTIPITSSQIIDVPNATVAISDNRGNTETLKYSENGIYLTSTLSGINDGRVYTLNVTIGDKLFTANSVMPVDLIPLDSINTIPDEDNDGRYVVRLYTTVHTSFDEYYMFRFYRNDTLSQEPDDVYVADNKQLNGKIDGIETVGNYRKGDKFSFKFFSLTKEAYQFYNALNEQINTDGGTFSTPPANVKGNIPGALGLFQATYVEYVSYVLDDKYIK